MSVRNYHQEADLDRVLQLYNSSSENLSRFSRDRDVFNHFTNYPGVQPGGIFICESDGEIQGVVIAAILGRKGLTEGSIIELWATNDSTAEMLVQRAFAYCCERGVDMVTIKPPMNKNADRIFDK